MRTLDAAIELSNLYEATGTEGTVFSDLIDREILPVLSRSLTEADRLSLGDRFSSIIDRVRGALGEMGAEHIRNLKEMMKIALQDYVRKTRDAITARELFHSAIMSGSETMLNVTASAILANALAKHNPNSAQDFVQKVAGKILGREIAENASVAAVGSAAIATVPAGPKRKRKARKDSIFVSDGGYQKSVRNESLGWQDLQDHPDLIETLRKIVHYGRQQLIDGVIVDPTTAELVLVTDQSLNGESQRSFRTKTLSEMIEFSTFLVEQGFLQVYMEEC